LRGITILGGQKKGPEMCAFSFFLRDLTSRSHFDQSPDALISDWLMGRLIGMRALFVTGEKSTGLAAAFAVSHPNGWNDLRRDKHS
jgi:hypothetical protein